MNKEEDHSLKMELCPKPRDLTLFKPEWRWLKPAAGL
jgi:hypothetical protein